MVLLGLIANNYGIGTKLYDAYTNTECIIARIKAIVRLANMELANYEPGSD
ncbi:MAG: hypothetical protein ACYDG2_08760 [Ruminiclostridium sp.]